MNKKLIAVRRPESQGIEPYRDNTLAVLSAENEALRAELESTKKKQQVYNEVFNVTAKVLGWAFTTVWCTLNFIYGMCLITFLFFHMKGLRITHVPPSIQLFVTVMSIGYFVHYVWIWLTEPTTKSKSND